MVIKSLALTHMEFQKINGLLLKISHNINPLRLELKFPPRRQIPQTPIKPNHSIILRHYVQTLQKFLISSSIRRYFTNRRQNLSPKPIIIKKETNLHSQQNILLYCKLNPI